MARFRGIPEPGRRLILAVWALAAINVLLLADALLMGRDEVTDGSGSVTNGWTVAAGIAATLAAAALLPRLPTTRILVAQAQAFVLGAQALHAAGHLLRIYYVFPLYDDVLHFGLILAVGLLLFSFSRSRRFLFTRRLGPARVALLIWFLSTAVAGLWEIFEFAMDLALGTREQDNLFDTMVDMVDGTLGGLVAGLVAAREIRREKQRKLLADAHSDELLD